MFMPIPGSNGYARCLDKNIFNNRIATFDKIIIFNFFFDRNFLYKINVSEVYEKSILFEVGYTFVYDMYIIDW